MVIVSFSPIPCMAPVFTEKLGGDVSVAELSIPFPSVSALLLSPLWWLSGIFEKSAVNGAFLLCIGCDLNGIDDDIFGGLVVVIGFHSGNLIYNVHPFDDLAKDGMLVIQVGSAAHFLILVNDGLIIFSRLFRYARIDRSLDRGIFFSASAL